MKQLDKTFLLGVGITNQQKEKILEYLGEFLKTPNAKGYIVTPNPEILVFADKNNDFKTVLNNAILALPDGVGVLWGSNILGNPIKYRIPGSEFVENVCELVAKQPITVGFLGGKRNVALRASECLKEKYPGLKVGYAIEEWPESEAKSKDLKCDILFVALGHPKQEFWITKNLENINIKVAMGVGGTLDYISGNVKRAPVWVRRLGFEWLFRLLIQPWRIKRQASLIYFVLLILKQRLFGKNY